MISFTCIPSSTLPLGSRASSTDSSAVCRPSSAGSSGGVLAVSPHCVGCASTVYSMLTDEEAVARVQMGQTEWFELIFDRHYTRIARSVSGSGLSEADQEDVVAETFTRALARIRSF